MPIVTDGLVGYWNSKHGVSGDVWENISPNTVGLYNATAIGSPIVSQNGMYFDGIDDKFIIPIPSELRQVSSVTMEFRIKLENYESPIDIFSYSDVYFIYPYYDGANLFIELETDQRLIRYDGFIGNNTEVYVTVVYETGSRIGRAMIYINGVQATNTTSYGIGTGLNFFRGNSSMIMGSWTTDHPKGIIDNLRLYNRVLTPQEVLQNYSVRADIGLPMITEPPKATITSVSRDKISDETGVDKSTIKFTFDQDIIQWTVNVMGSSHDTGIIADYGGAVSAGVEITAEVDWTELYQEGQNRVNIYGQNSNGQWTLYEG